MASNSFLYQTQAPSSPVTSNSQVGQEEIYFNSDHTVDYMVSPKPSTSRMTPQPDNLENTSNNKRRSSTGSTNNCLKPIKLAADKELVLKRDHYIKPTSSTSSTTPSCPLVITPKANIKFEKKKNSKLYRKERLKQAKNEYEERIEEYFEQLTVGCQQRDCLNKFCASGRGGILSLQPQAALIMSIQLASMPGSRLCIINSDHVHVTQKETERDNTQEPTRKPFLTSLFTSTPFMGLLNKQPPKEKKQKDHHWSTDFWKLFSHFNNDDDHIIADEGYYQIDQEQRQDTDMLLAIPPLSVNLDHAVEYLHRSIVTQSISEDKMDTWCRSIFQSWEGIGNSFLSGKFIQLEDLTRFYQLVIHQDKKLKNTRQIRIMEAISDSFETLLDRMALNVESLTAQASDHTRIMYEWCRSIMAVVQWIICCKEKKQKEEQDGLAALVAKLDDVATNQKRAASIASTSQIILIHKLIQVLSKMSRKKTSIIRKLMLDMLANLDPTRMTLFIGDLHQYLSDHYHTGPYKHGLEDTAIMTLKCLELVYQANMKTPNSPIVPIETFYSDSICKKLNIKNEYRIWKRVLLHGEGRHSALITRQGESEHQRRSRLFMTTSSSLLPYPFENEYQFSWFSYPFLLPPSIKRKVVLIDAMSQMSLEYEDACVNHTLVVHAQKLLSEAPLMLKNLETNLRSATCPYLLLEIRREHFVTDTLKQLSRKWSDLKKPLKVKFIHGGEEGMDQGGVQKEFFGVLFEKLVSPEVGLFSQDDQTRLCWIRHVVEPDIRMYEMVGVMMGLSVYNGVIMNLQFPKVLWKVLVMPNESLIEIMAEKQVLFTLDDLEEGWPGLGNGLRQLLNWHDQVEDVFCRDYEISMDIYGKGIETISLLPNKDDPVVPVTNENREQYVKDYCTFFMYTAQKEQLLALRRGMWSVIGSRALSLCTAEELEMVACGLRQGPDSIELNMAELESVAEYDDGYNADHPTIRQFWSVVHHDLTNDQKKQLLLFVTASDRVPVGGLKELSFYIQRNGPDSDRLPTALTCFSRLLLPEYASRQKLRDRLITAIENTKGFGLV
ncbi:uncharacterized protein EV154DRAFT_504399, partial [Mucor mucedo]|uniref:uncharacterized protein n=1 Tax=Mucor mucedo TaxID=29922 RepID=UPI002220F5DD